MMSTTDDPRIGRTLTIAPAKHAGHTVTVERRDIEKHKAYWLRCSCGAVGLLGEHWLDEYLAAGGVWPLYDGQVRF